MGETQEQARERLRSELRARVPEERRLRERLAAVRGRIRRLRDGIRRRSRPRIITAEQLGLTFSYAFGAKGPVYRGAGHYSASKRCRTAAELVESVRAFHGFHTSLGWGGLSYEALVGDDGTIVLGNPTDRKSAAVALNNTGMVGICVPGTTGDRMTPACKQSIRWLLDNWHTPAIPARHRLAEPARSFGWKGHREYPDQSTSCPGDMLVDYKELFS